MRCARAITARPSGVGSARRPLRSISATPRRCSSARTACDTADCVTPSDSAAWENDPRSTTAQSAASCRVSMCSGRSSDGGLLAVGAARVGDHRAHALERSRLVALVGQALDGVELALEPLGRDRRAARAHELVVVGALDLLGILEEALVQLLARPDAA